MPESTFIGYEDVTIDLGLTYYEKRKNADHQCHAAS